MNQIQIQGTEIQIKEYNGQRVVTFKDIDTVHKRPDGTAKRNFKANRQRFISGVDFFLVRPSDFSQDEIRPTEINSQGTTLITESGYLMLVKSFTDDLAWKVQRELVETYFRVRTSVNNVSTIEPNAEMYMEASKIMAGCLEGNRPYVLNILRHIIPDIDREEIKKISEQSKKQLSPSKKPSVNPGVPIDIPKMLEEMGSQNISVEVLAKRANVSSITISNWIAGKHQPVLQNRINVCVALGKDENFLTPRRTRNVR